MIGERPAKSAPVVCSVARRDHPGDAPRTEIFEVDIGPDATLHELLLAIAKNPTPRAGARVKPPTWDAHCLEGSCGGCTLRAGGRAVLACTTRIDEVAKRRGVVVLEPLGVFPVVRDLVVDHTVRDRDIDAMTFTPRSARSAATSSATAVDDAAATAAERSALGACIACGACLDACPEVSLTGGFVGAEAIAKNRRLHAAPAAAPADRTALDDALRRPGGIAECGHAQTCVDVCPTGVPLAEALADASRAAASRTFARWRRR